MKLKAKDDASRLIELIRLKKRAKEAHPKIQENIQKLITEEASRRIGEGRDRCSGNE